MRKLYCVSVCQCECLIFMFEALLCLFSLPHFTLVMCNVWLSWGMQWLEIKGRKGPYVTRLKSNPVDIEFCHSPSGTCSPFTVLLYQTGNPNQREIFCMWDMSCWLAVRERVCVCVSRKEAQECTAGIHKTKNKISSLDSHGRQPLHQWSMINTVFPHINRLMQSNNSINMWLWSVNVCVRVWLYNQPALTVTLKNQKFVH